MTGPALEPRPGRGVVIAAAAGVFALAVISRDLVFSIPGYREGVAGLPAALRWLEEPLRIAIIVVMGLWAVYRQRPLAMARELGLASSPVRPVLFAFLASLPMLVGFTAVGNLNPEFTVMRGLIFGAIIWPLSEELLFRGYAFGQFHRRGNMNLWIAAIGTGVIFGLLHLGNASVQGLPLSGEIGVVAITSIGGVLFCWLFARWDFNLYAPLALHGFMNLWWSVFDLADSPLGGWFTNGMRGLTVVLAIVLTIYRDRIPGLRTAESPPVAQAA